jgi:uncharacterized protein with HEPN domain
MRRDRLPLLLEQMLESARFALDFVEGLSEEEFLADQRTRHASAMCLINIGEYVARIGREVPVYFAEHPEIEWNNIVGMRNRIAHGYTTLDMRVVWETIRDNCPNLVARLPDLLEEAEKWES